MQFILLLLLVFTIGCVLYGISAGVQAIRRSTAWFTEPKYGSGESIDKTALAPQVNPQSNKAHAPNLLDSQHSIDDLKTFFDLYQQGALTTEEFKEMKQHLLRSLRSMPSGC